MKQCVTTAILIALCLHVRAQTDDPKKLFSEAEGYIEFSDYQRALPVFLKLVQMDPGNANLNYKVGMCYLNSPSDQGKAIPFFKKAITSTTSKYKVGSFSERSAPDDAFYYVARSFHLGYEIDSALHYYEKFRPFIKEKLPHLVPEVERQEQMCRNARDLMAQKVDITILNLGSKINTSYPEYAPVISADESVLIFTSSREGSTGGMLTNDGYFFEDIYVSYKENGAWTAPSGIGATINTADHEATIGLSADGQQLYIYRDDNGDGNIYVSNLAGETWSVPEKLGPTINSPHLETHASLSADGTRLYFTSDRPGGQGGLDIYVAKLLPNGQWSLAQNLGPAINSPFDEDGPFMHPDGVTLYFSSEGPKSMGGFDIFSTVFNEEDNSWSEPVNMGYPVNTTADDVFFVLSADGKRAYYSSAATDGYGDYDLYMLVFEKREEVALTVMKGTVTIGETGVVPQDAKITVRDHETDEILGIYTPNRATGKYLFILAPGKNYNISFEAGGFHMHSENLFVPQKSSYNEVSKAIKLRDMKVKDKIELRDIYFEYNSAKLTKESERELDKLYNFLKNNYKLVVSIEGHTDDMGSAAFNMKLSQKRTEAVRDYLIAKGIFAARLRAKGYGSTRPIARNKKPDGSDNPEGRALNRRIEIIIIGADNELDVVKKDEVPEHLKVKD